MGVSRTITIGAATALAAALAVAGRAIASGGGPPTAELAVVEPAASGSAPAALAGTTLDPEGLFVPIEPCRIADTRHGTGTGGTKLGAGKMRNFHVLGASASGFAAQGGTSCGIPTTAMAVQLTALVVSPSKAGGLKVWPVGSTEPVAKFFQYAKATSSGSGVAKVRAGASTSIRIKNYTSSTPTWWRCPATTSSRSKPRSAPAARWCGERAVSCRRR